MLAAALLTAALAASDATAEAFTRANEGLRLVAYADSRGVATIGFGHRMLPGERPTMTKDEAERCFQRDYAAARATVDRLALGRQPRLVEVVLVDMAYNLGDHGLARFRFFLAAIARRDYISATTELRLSHYAIQCPHRVERLCALLTRAAEKESPDAGHDLPPVVDR